MKNYKKLLISATLLIIPILLFSQDENIINFSDASSFGRISYNGAATPSYPNNNPNSGIVSVKDNKSHVHSGNTAMRLVVGLSDKPLSWGSLNIKLGKILDQWAVPIVTQPKNASKFKYLSFWIKGESGGERIKIGFRDKHEKTFLPTQLAVPYLADNKIPDLKKATPVSKLPDTKWHRLIVPLTELENVDIRNIVDLSIDLSDNLPGWAVVFIDDLKFINKLPGNKENTSKGTLKFKKFPSHAVIADFETERTPTAGAIGSWGGAQSNPFDSQNDSCRYGPPVKKYKKENIKNGRWSYRIVYGKNGLPYKWASFSINFGRNLDETKGIEGYQAFDITEFSGISFWIKAKKRTKFSLALMDNKATVFYPPQVSIKPLKKGLPTSKWTFIKVPFTQDMMEHVDLTRLISLSLNLSHNFPGEGEVFIDDFKFYISEDTPYLKYKRKKEKILPIIHKKDKRSSDILMIDDFENKENRFGVKNITQGKAHPQATVGSIISGHYSPGMKGYYTQNVFNGKHSYRIVIPKGNIGQNWALFSIPLNKRNNDKPGYQDLSKYSKLTFWVRGSRGNEKIRMIFRDTRHTKIIPSAILSASIDNKRSKSPYLTILPDMQWHKLTIDLDKIDYVNWWKLTSIELELSKNIPEGALIYIDDIYLSGKRKNYNFRKEHYRKYSKDGLISDLEMPYTYPLGNIGAYGNASPNFFDTNPDSSIYNFMEDEFDPANIKSGKASYRIVFGQNNQKISWGSVSFELGQRYDKKPHEITSADVTEFSHLSFWIRGKNGKEKFDVRLFDESIRDFGKTQWKNTPFPDGLPDKNWHRITIPLNNKSYKNINLKRLIMISFNFSHGKGILYLDDIKFIKKNKNNTSWKTVPVKLQAIKDSSPFSIKLLKPAKEFRKNGKIINFETGTVYMTHSDAWGDAEPSWPDGWPDSRRYSKGDFAYFPENVYQGKASYRINVGKANIGTGWASFSIPLGKVLDHKQEPIKLEPFDVTGFGTLSFYIKSEEPGGKFRVVFRDAYAQSYLAQETITPVIDMSEKPGTLVDNKWHKVKIKLPKIMNCDLSQLVEIGIDLSDNLPDYRVFYVDDFKFENKLPQNKKIPPRPPVNGIPFPEHGIITGFETFYTGGGGKIDAWGDAAPNWQSSDPVSWFYGPATVKKFKPENVRTGRQSFRVFWKRRKNGFGWASLSINLGPVIKISKSGDQLVQGRDISKFSKLILWVKGTQGEEKLRIILTDTKSQTAYPPPFEFIPFKHKGLPDKKWHKIVVPLKSAKNKLDLKMITSIILSFSDNLPEKGMMYIDDVHFE